MPRFEPFIARRYAPDVDLDAVNAPPYDVLGPHDLERLRARDQHNIVHIDVPVGDARTDPYTRAAELLAQWTRAGVLVDDGQPSFTLYRMTFTDEAGTARTTVGVLGALEVVDAGAPGVLPHERTTPKATTDRLDLTRATRANLSPVWGLSLTAGLTALLDEPGDVLGTVTDEAGVVHRVERVDDPQRVAAIAAAVGAAPVLIADGHHRYAIARTYRDEVADAGNPALADAAQLTLAYVGELVSEQLSIAAIHRLYRATTADRLLGELLASFDAVEQCVVDRAVLGRMKELSALCLVRPDGTGTLLRKRAAAFAGVRELDGAALEHALAQSTAQVAYQHGVDEVLEALREGAADAAVLIRPTDIAEIRRTADEGLLMPPKSTFFTPKLRTGLVLRSLESQASN